MSRHTVANVIERCRRQLASSLRNEVNALGSNLNSTATTLTMAYDVQNSISPGAILSINKELLRVVAVNVAAKEVTVIRGWQDSEAAAHVANDEILVNPRFTRFDIYDALVDEISSWSPNLFWVSSYQWNVTEDQETVELPASLSDALGVIELRRQWSDETDNSSWPRLDYRVMRGFVGTWDAATTSGLLIRMIPNFGTMRAGKVMALVGRPFDVTTVELQETNNLVTDFNLSPSMIDLLVLGIKVRLMIDDENGRSGRFTQDEPRRAEEVQAGAALTVGQTLRNNYQRRFGDEMRKLQDKYRMACW